MLREVYKVHVLAVEFLRDIVKKFINITAYEAMEKADDIKILSGEFIDDAEIIYASQLVQ